MENFVVINNVARKLIPSESTTDFVERLASDWNTLPDFLSFDPPLNYLSTSFINKSRYVVADLLASVRNSPTIDSPALKDFPEKIKRYAQQIFIATNQVLESAPLNELETILNHVSIVSATDLSFSQVLDAWNRRISIVDKLDASIAELQSRVASKLNGFENVVGIAKSDPEFKRIVVSTVARLSIPYDIKDLFNSINLNERVPFAYCDGTFKIVSDLKDSRYVDEWIELSGDRLLILKVDSTIVGSGVKFATAAIAMSDDDSKQMAMTVDTFVGKKHLSIDGLLDRIKTSFDFDDVRRGSFRLEEISVTGYVAYPKQELVPSLFADVAMNDDDVSSLIVIDEFYRASKKKRDVHVRVLESGVTVNLTETTTTKYNMFRGIFGGIGERYVRARIKASTTNQLIFASSTIARVFTRYNEKRNEIIESYRKFIPDYMTEITTSSVKRKKKVSVRDLEPEIFFPNYSRKCLYRPTIIDDEIADVGNLQTMRFPKFGESQQRTYVCENPTHPYPGLQPNVLENKYKFPYVPCCYAKPQMGNPNSAYERYFSSSTRPTYDESVAFQRKRKMATAETTSLSETAATKKHLQKGVFGKLPDDINSLLVCVGKDPSKLYFRLGVSSSELSCIECVAKSLGSLNLESSDEIIDEYVERAYNDIISDDHYLLASMQELYDVPNVETIRSNLRSDRSFFTAANFVRTLETYFDCDIFILNPNGVTVPRHAGGIYLKYVPRSDRRTVILYEHFGSDLGTNLRRTARCELVGYENIYENKILHFDDSQFSNDIYYDVFRESTKSFLNGKLVAVPRYPPYYDSVVNQSLDSYGKCRLVNVEFTDDTSDKNYLITILVDILPPFSAAKLNRIYGPDSAIVQKFIDEYDIKPVFQRSSIDLDKMMELHCDDGSVIYFVGNLIPDVPVGELEKSLVLPYMYRDVTRSFTTSKRLARYLKAFSFRYMLNDRPESIKSAAEKFIVDTKRNWTSIDSIDSNNFNDQRLNRLFVSDDDRLYVPSKECVSRLLFEYYHLVKYSNENVLSSFVSSIKIPDSYSDVFDYKIRYGQYVISNYSTAKQLAKIVKFRPDNIRQTLMSPDEKHPYYLTTNNYKNLHVVQNVESLREARKACVFFRVKRYNGYVATLTTTTTNETTIIDASDKDYNYYEQEYVDFDDNLFDPDDIEILAFEGSNLPLLIVKRGIESITIAESNCAILVYKYDGKVCYSAIFNVN